MRFRFRQTFTVQMNCNKRWRMHQQQPPIYDRQKAILVGFFLGAISGFGIGALLTFMLVFDDKTSMKMPEILAIGAAAGGFFGGIYGFFIPQECIKPEENHDEVDPNHVAALNP